MIYKNSKKYLSILILGSLDAAADVADEVCGGSLFELLHGPTSPEIPATIHFNEFEC